MNKQTRQTVAASLLVDVERATGYILAVQRKDGEIPWSRGGQTDHWDHVENAMALTVGGHYPQARMAYRWSKASQLEDGSWWSGYEGGRPKAGAYKDPNMGAYIAVGLLHYHVATRDDAFVEEMWETVCRAMDFVVTMQGAGGHICWAKTAGGEVAERGLLTGSCSIYLSLTCALGLAAILGRVRRRWTRARKRLGEAIVKKPHLFDQTKSRYAMDWYYPVLGGILKKGQAEDRILRRWHRFVIPHWGVRCVSDKPWITIGETAELSMSLSAMGNFRLAEAVLSWISDKKYTDGAFWTGVTVPDGVIYTEERTTWSGAGVILAADMIHGFSRAHRFFRHGFVDSIAGHHLRCVK